MNGAISEPSHYLWEVRLSRYNAEEVTFAASGNHMYRKGGGVPVAIHRLPFDQGLTLTYFEPPIFNVIRFNRVISWLTDILNLQAVEENPEEIKIFFDELKRAIDEREWARFKCIYNSLNKSYEIIPLDHKGKRDTYFSAQTIKSIKSMDQKFKVKNGTFEQVPDSNVPPQPLTRPKTIGNSQDHINPAPPQKKQENDQSQLTSMLMGEKNKLKREKGEQKEKIENLERQISKLTEQIKGLNSKVIEQEGEIKRLQNISDGKEEESERDKLKRNIYDLLTEWKDKYQSIMNVNAGFEKMLQELSKYGSKFETPKSSLRIINEAKQTNKEFDQLKDLVEKTEPMLLLEKINNEIKSKTESLVNPWDSALIELLKTLSEKARANKISSLDDIPDSLRDFIEFRNYKLLWPKKGDDFISSHHIVLDEQKGDVGRGKVIRAIAPGIERNKEVIVKAAIYLAK